MHARQSIRTPSTAYRKLSLTDDSMFYTIQAEQGVNKNNRWHNLSHYLSTTYQTASTWQTVIGGDTRSILIVNIFGFHSKGNHKTFQHLRHSSGYFYLERKLERILWYWSIRSGYINWNQDNRFKILKPLLKYGIVWWCTPWNANRQPCSLIFLQKANLCVVDFTNVSRC